MAKKIDKAFKEINFEVSPFGPPFSKGVYAVCVVKNTHYPPHLKTQKVVYIGSSVNIIKRISSQKHIYRRLYNLLKSYNVSCFYYECENYQEVEQELIKKYKPRFNIQHNK